MSDRRPQRSTQHAYSRLADAASAYFIDATHFLGAFERNALATTLGFRDNPVAFGQSRSYLGKLHLGRLHTQCLVAARNLLRIRHGADAAQSTYHGRTAKTPIAAVETLAKLDPPVIK